MIFLLFLAFLFESYFSSEIGFIISVVILLCFSFVYGVRFFVAGVRIWAPFVFCIVVGFIYGFFENPVYLVAKDLWYFVKPLIYFYIGIYLSMYTKENKVWGVIFFASTFMAMLYVIPVISDPSSLDMTADERRDAFGQGTTLFLFGLIALLNVWKKVKFHFLYGVLFIPILLALFLSSSRMFLLLFLVFLLASFSFSYRYLVSKYVVLGAFLCVFVFIVPAGGSSVDEGERGSFLNKILFSIQEIRPQLYLSDWDIHDRWRGYETYMAVNQYLRGDAYNKLFGMGFGESVMIDFPKRARTTDEYLYELDWLHNGYVTVLLKMGGVGFLSLLFFLYSVWVPIKSINNTYIFVVFSIVITNFVLGGMFNKTDVLVPMMLLGFYYMRNVK